MVIGKKQGVGILLFGLLLLTGGILVLITVPSWGNWLSDYPAQATQLINQQAPAQVAPMAQSIMNFVLGGLIKQVGGYINTAGYFVGSLLSLIALVVSSAGITIVSKRA
jgi:hypothetical protein